MAITKQKKKEILDKLCSLFTDAQSSVFVNFHGLSVADTSTMRQKLRDENVAYFVAKKTLIRKALEDKKFAGEIPALDGEIAVAYTTGTDTTAPARLVHTFQKDHTGKVALVGGIFENAFLNQERMLEIATIPSMQILRGMFVNVINAPIQGLVIALSQIAEKKQ